MASIVADPVLRVELACFISPIVNGEYTGYKGSAVSLVSATSSFLCSLDTNRVSQLGDARASGPTVVDFIRLLMPYVGMQHLVVFSCDLCFYCCASLLCRFSWPEQRL